MLISVSPLTCSKTYFIKKIYSNKVCVPPKITTLGSNPDVLFRMRCQYPSRFLKFFCLEANSVVEKPKRQTWGI
jgi:hypothetical protein